MCFICVSNLCTNIHLGSNYCSWFFAFLCISVNFNIYVSCECCDCTASEILPRATLWSMRCTVAGTLCYVSSVTSQFHVLTLKITSRTFTRLSTVNFVARPLNEMMLNGTRSEFLQCILIIHLFRHSYNQVVFLLMTCMILFSIPLVTRRLAGKSISKMTCFRSIGTLHLNSFNWSACMICNSADKRQVNSVICLLRANKVT